MRVLLPIAAFLLGLTTILIVGQLRDRSTHPSPATGLTGTGVVRAANADAAATRDNAIVRAVQRISDSVVTIAVHAPRSTLTPNLPEAFRDIFSRFAPAQPEQEWTIASGVIMDENGIVLTNEHVLKGADDLWVVLADGRFFGKDVVDVVGRDPHYDLAVLRIKDSPKLHAATLGDSRELIVGEWVIAIGNPFGFYFRDSRPSVTVGVVSGLRREVSSDVRAGGAIYKDMIQTDASINPGNSGGALVNAAGEVIGINTFILTGGPGNAGLGFAIPIHVARDVMGDLVQYGHSREPWVGLGVSDINPQIRRDLGIPNRDGIVVRRIDPGSPADRAGFELYDVIVSVNGRPISNRDEAIRAIFGSRIGSTLRFAIERAGMATEIRLTLEERPATDGAGG
jgi:serine protease Do